MGALLYVCSLDDQDRCVEEMSVKTLSLKAQQTDLQKSVKVWKVNSSTIPSYLSDEERSSSKALSASISDIVETVFEQ